MAYTRPWPGWVKKAANINTVIEIIRVYIRSWKPLLCRKDTEKGITDLIQKYGKICGFWLGPQKAVVIADFEIIHELLNKPEVSDRQDWAVAGRKHLYKSQPF